MTSARRDLSEQPYRTPSYPSPNPVSNDKAVVKQEELISALQRSEPEATNSVYRRLYPLVAKAVQRTCPGSSDLEDIVQLALERVHRSIVLGRFSGDCSLAGWAVVIARNTAVDILRANDRESRLLVNAVPPSDFEAAIAYDIERELMARSDLKRLQFSLSALSGKLATAVISCDVLEMSVDETARRLGVSKQAVHSRLRRGRIRLKRSARRSSA